MGTLYLVSTPIGNLEDITLRALRVLREAHLIAAEDTRHTRHLLTHYDIRTPCTSYHEHNKLARLDEILAALAQGDVALVSDAGTPALSDPGFELVQVCVAAGFEVSPVPGAGAPLAALVASGLPTDQFLYVGFLPRRRKVRRTFLGTIASNPATLVCFEAPHRIVASLTDALDILGDRQVAIAREMTKRHEEFIRTSIGQALAHVQAQRPRGEFTLVIAGYAPGEQGEAGGQQPASAAQTPPEPDEATIVARMHELHAQGYRTSQAASQVAREWGLTKKTVYDLWVRQGDSS
jgi:16S rRNA (cytidine1402-2'-O)-methyltransferase